jgi:hypothetical protein
MRIESGAEPASATAGAPVHKVTKKADEEENSAEA